MLYYIIVCILLINVKYIYKMNEFFTKEFDSSEEDDDYVPDKSNDYI